MTHRFDTSVRLVGMVLMLAGAVAFAGCRREPSPRRPEVLSQTAGPLHLLDHLNAAAEVDLPLFDDFSSRSAIEKFEERLIGADDDRRKMALFPAPAEQVTLTRMTLDRDTGTFMALPTNGQAAEIEIARAVELNNYDVVSVRFAASGGTSTLLQWTSGADVGYRTEDAVLIKGLYDGKMHTYDIFLRGQPIAGLAGELWRSRIRQEVNVGEASSPEDGSRWSGRMSSLKFVPTNGAGLVTVESVTLYATAPFAEAVRQHPREAILAVVNDQPVAAYGKHPFQRKFRIDQTVQEGLLAFGPSQVSFDVDLVEDAVLVVGCALLSQSVAFNGSNAASFAVEIRDLATEAEPTPLLDETLSVSESRSAPARLPHRVDLSAYANRRVRLTFRTESETPGAAPVWLDPTVFARPPTSPLNVILFSADTLRADHLGSYGYSRDTSPRIDALAAEGVRFKTAYSTAPWTLPAHMSMMTGLYPAHHQVIDALDSVASRDQLDPGVPTLAGYLRDRGFTTVALTDGGHVASVYGFCQGFDRYADNAGGRESAYQPTQSRNTVDAFLDWLKNSPGRPFFAFLHTYQVHTPLNAPPPFRTQYVDPQYGGPLGEVFVEHEGKQIMKSKSLPRSERFDSADVQHVKNLYDGEIRYLDTNIGVLIDGLREAGQLENTILVFTSDHGEEFAERGQLCEHGHTFFNELLRVPLILYGPGRLPGGQEVGGNVSLVDLFPTIAELCGFGQVEGLQGRSVLPHIRGEVPVDRHLFAEAIINMDGIRKYSNKEKALVHDGWKLISSGPPENDFQLFRFETDPSEVQDLFSDNSTEAKRYQSVIGQYRATAPVRKTPPRYHGWSSDEQQRVERLKGLGYVK
jgi:arylsulfatase A-like enzyme